MCQGKKKWCAMFAFFIYFCDDTDYKGEQDSVMCKFSAGGNRNTVGKEGHKNE